MTGRYFAILSSVILILLGMAFAVQAQDVEMHLNMFKEVSSGGEAYGIRFGLSNDVLKKVSRVFIRGPRGRRIWVNNTLNLNEILLSAVGLSRQEFNLWFPEGEYQISLSPPAFGKLEVQMTHNFPSTPAVIYPLEGSADVPTNPVITWGPITDIIGLRLQLKDDAGFVFGAGLPINATSYAVPADLLKPNTRYELSLEAKVTDFGGNGLSTTMLISFTTLPQ